MGRILDLVAVPAVLGGNIPPGFPRPKLMGIHQKVSAFERYDDLLLSGHRLLAQIVVFASGEHFQYTFLASSAEVGICTVVLCTFLK